MAARAEAQRPPRAPGTYALVLHLPRRMTIGIGRFGTFAFPAGAYLYVGSALGPGGLAARIAHHARITITPHWHVDYLRRRAELVGIWHRASAERCEHLWAAALARLPGATTPVARFGASDCRCGSHLVHSASLPSLERFRRLVAQDGVERAQLERAARTPRGRPRAKRLP